MWLGCASKKVRRAGVSCWTMLRRTSVALSLVDSFPTLRMRVSCARTTQEEATDVVGLSGQLATTRMLRRLALLYYSTERCCMNCCVQKQILIYSALAELNNFKDLYARTLHTLFTP
jgi:hypothetical protein